MPKKSDKDSTSLKEELRKEEVKERFTNLAFDLFSKDASDETVKREISIFVPNATVDTVQRLRKQWESKVEADKEIEAIEHGDRKPSEEMVEPLVEPEIIPEVEHPVEPKVKLEVKEESPVEKTAEKVVEKAPEGTEPPDLESEKVFKAMAEVEEISKFAMNPPTEIEGETISKAPTPSLRDEIEVERSRAEIVRATEELRRAITSEIRAQESYEHARLEMEEAKRELGVVRSELDEFKRDVDLLKLKERVVEREPIEQPVLKSETEMGMRFEEEISRRPFKHIVEEMISKKVDEVFNERGSVEKLEEPREDREGGEEKKEEETKEKKKIDEIAGKTKKEEEKPSEPVFDPIISEDIVETQVSIRLAEICGCTISELHKLVDEKKPLALAPPHVKEFYDRVMRHLKSNGYLVVKKEGDRPEVFHLKLRLVGLLAGLGIGLPVGCLVLYIILLLAGVL